MRRGITGYLRKNCWGWIISVMILGITVLHITTLPDALGVREFLRILIIDDKDNMGWTLQKALVKEGHRVLTAADGVAGFHAIMKDPLDLMLTDLKMPGIFYQVRLDIMDPKSYNRECIENIVYN